MGLTFFRKQYENIISQIVEDECCPCT